MSSEYQELLEKLLNSDTTDVIPQSRAEYIMLTAINSLSLETLPEPDSRMEAYLMALITKMGEGGSASQTQSDWNQNDITQPDYVKNRPFYTSDPVETEIFDVVALMDAGAYQWSIQDGKMHAGYEAGHSLFFDTPLVVGDKYKIQYNGANYECIAMDGTEFGMSHEIVVLTSATYETPDGEYEFIVSCAPKTLADPSDTSGKWFVVLCILNTETPSTELKVISQKTKIVKINPKYIDFPIETDPTVPAWAKEPTKPTYTAYEIKAQPDMYVLNFDKLIDNLTAKTVVYISQASSTSPIPYERYPVLVMRSAIDHGSASIVAYDSTGKTWAGDVNFQSGTINLKERTLAASDIGAISAPATAEVGQTLVVKSVDENGHPTEWEAVGMEGVPTVTTANNDQFLRVVNGAWAAATVPSAEEASF